MNPQLSVVVPSVNTPVDVLDCMQHLERQRDEVDLQVIVVERQGARTRDLIRTRFPWVDMIEVDDDSTIPGMRATAFERARGDVVAVIEDHVMVPDGWARQMLRAMEQADGVVGGSVDNAATTSLLDWAAFLCEYSHLITPIQEGEVDWLAGNNVAYKRPLLERFSSAAQNDKWENFLHDRMREGGIRLICRPEITVGHKKHYAFREYVAQRYYYSRSYAGARVAGASRLKRFVYGAGSVVLPPLLYWRITRTVWRKGRYRKQLLLSLPLMAVFVAAWGIGEGVGYLFGAGEALKKVR